MNIIKHNETFLLEETTDLYEMSGNITHEASGAFNIHFNVKRLNGESLGDCSYNKYKDSNIINFNISSEEEVRNELTEYAMQVVNTSLEFFK